MLANAVRLCDAQFGTLNLYDGEAFRSGALHNVPPAYADVRRGMVIRPDPRSSLGGIVANPAGRARRRFGAPSHTSRAIRRPGLSPTWGGARTLVTVPMVKEDELVGAIGIYRQEVRPFTASRSSWSKTLLPRP